MHALISEDYPFQPGEIVDLIEQRIKESRGNLHRIGREFTGDLNLSDCCRDFLEEVYSAIANAYGVLVIPVSVNRSISPEEVLTTTGLHTGSGRAHPKSGVDSMPPGNGTGLDHKVPVVLFRPDEITSDPDQIMSEYSRRGLCPDPYAHAALMGTNRGLCKFKSSSFWPDSEGRTWVLSFTTFYSWLQDLSQDPIKCDWYVGTFQGRD